MQSYLINPDGTAITCRRCGLVSHHPMDISRRYCGNCKMFHEAMQQPRRPRPLVSSEVSAVLAYLRALEEYARALETACEQLLIVNRALIAARDEARRAAEHADDPPF